MEGGAGQERAVLTEVGVEGAPGGSMAEGPVGGMGQKETGVRAAGGGGRAGGSGGAGGNGAQGICVIAYTASGSSGVAIYGFNSAGVFNVPSDATGVSYLVVAGGASGGGTTPGSGGGGGGGAGGML